MPTRAECLEQGGCHEIRWPDQPDGIDNMTGTPDANHVTLTTTLPGGPKFVSYSIFGATIFDVSGDSVCTTGV